MPKHEALDRSLLFLWCPLSLQFSSLFQGRQTPLRDQAGLITAVLFEPRSLPVHVLNSLGLLATAAAHHGGVPWTLSTTGRTLAMRSSTRCRSFASPESWRVQRRGESSLTSMRYISTRSTTSPQRAQVNSTAVSWGSGHSRHKENITIVGHE